MEPNLEISNITIPNPPQDDVEPKPKPVLTRKRKNGVMHAIRVALFMMRGRSKKQSVIPVDNESTNGWKKLVGSIRPLHLQSSQSPHSFSQSNSQKFNQVIILLPHSPYESIDGGSVFTDFTAEEEPFSPSPESPENSRYASAIGLSELVQSDENSRYASAIGLNELVQSDEDSRYASAIGLNELVQSDEENDKQNVIIEECNENEDDMIDAKADEFIAQFYQQMRLQRLNNVDRRYQERSQRSLGF